MKVTVKRTRSCPDDPKGVMFSEFEGVLYEYQGFQFCIGNDNGLWRAIELQTGYQACCYESEVNDSVDYCMKIIITGLETHTIEKYYQALNHAKMSLEFQDIKIPINEKIQTDDNKNR